jgi:hypothetical protein
VAILGLYDRMQHLAVEEKRTPDSSLPDPSTWGISASETEWAYELWAQWRALGKPPNVSVLVNEIVNGYGGVITLLLELESIYAKTKQQLEEQSPKHGKQ